MYLGKVTYNSTSRKAKQKPFCLSLFIAVTVPSPGAKVLYCG